MIRRAFTAGLVAVACSLGISSAVAAVTAAPSMERTAAYILAYCRESRRLPLACPHLLPRMGQPSPHWETSVCVVGHTGCQGLTWDDLSLVGAGSGTRPPVWSHISIYAGNLKSAFRFAYPTRGVRPRRLDGLFARTRTHAIFLGSYTWGGKHGTVVLAPDYPGGGEQGDHLIFRWRQSRTGFAVGLHAWEPLSTAFATLRVMVRSI
jgi:hypothetical protein